MGEEIQSNRKFYIYRTDPGFGIIRLGIFDRKGGNGKRRSREKMENPGKTCNFSPRANFVIKHRTSRNAFLRKEYEKGKSKSGMVITCKPMSTESLGVSSFPFWKMPSERKSQNVISGGDEVCWTLSSPHFASMQRKLYLMFQVTVHLSSDGFTP